MYFIHRVIYVRTLYTVRYMYVLYTQEIYVCTLYTGDRQLGAPGPVCLTGESDVWLLFL